MEYITEDSFEKKHFQALKLFLNNYDVINIKPYCDLTYSIVRNRTKCEENNIMETSICRYPIKGNQGC